MKTTYGKGQSRGQKGDKTEEKRRQLVQLLISLVLFLCVFIGKEVWPSKIAETGQQLLNVIGRNTDFRGAFARLGRAMAQEDSVIGELGDFCVSVFAPLTEEAKVLSSQGVSSAEQGDVSAAVENRVWEEMAEKEMQVGDVFATVEYTGEPLPEGYSAQYLFLGSMSTASPVQGVITSEFGYRDHPTIGRYAVHGGVDIAADTGAAVAAFASGTVQAVGEDKDFGLWVRLEHGNGVSSFYAHCSKIYVNEGQEVRVGERVADVGSSGISTGPHLHFEVALNDVRLDPMHYIFTGGAR